MGKNMHATECEIEDCEELCYYGSTVCNDCRIACEACGKTVMRKSSPFYKYVTSKYCKECKGKYTYSKEQWTILEDGKEPRTFTLEIPEVEEE